MGIGGGGCPLTVPAVQATKVVLRHRQSDMDNQDI